MQFRNLLDFLIRPIPAGEIPGGVRSRRVVDYAVAGVIGLGMAVGLLLVVNSQYDDAVPPPRKAAETPVVEESEPVEMGLTFSGDDGPGTGPRYFVSEPVRRAVVFEEPDSGLIRERVAAAEKAMEGAVQPVAGGEMKVEPVAAGPVAPAPQPGN